jgi:hypothetical protein
MLSSIYMPDELFLDEKTLKLNVLEKELELAMDDKNFEEAMKINSMMTS